MIDSIRCGGALRRRAAEGDAVMFGEFAGAKVVMVFEDGRLLETHQVPVTQRPLEWAEQFERAGRTVIVTSGWNLATLPEKDREIRRAMR